MQIVLDDRGPQLARLHKAAYPDVVPIMTTLPVAMAFSEALDVATSMPGWTIVASDIDAGRIEASQQSRWFASPTISSSGSSSTRREAASTCAAPASRVGLTTK